MAHAQNPPKTRPLSPHLSIWRWGPHLVVSILHRITGDGLAIFGTLGLLWWLVAAASGAEAYATFQYYTWHAAAGDQWGLVANIFSRVVLIGLTWAFFQHMFSGLRHFVMDIGAGYGLSTNRRWSLLILVLSIVATAGLWLWILGGRI